MKTKIDTTHVDLEKAWNLIYDALAIIPGGATSCEDVERKYEESKVLLDQAASLISAHFPLPKGDDD